MRQERDLQKDIQVAERARQLLKDPMLREALDDMRETVYHNIRTSHYSKTDEREDLYKMLKAIDAFESEFLKRIDKGKKAKSLLEKLFKKG